MELESQKSPLRDVLHRVIIAPEDFFFSSALWLPSNMTPCAQETASSQSVHAAAWQQLENQENSPSMWLLLQETTLRTKFCSSTQQEKLTVHRDR